MNDCPRCAELARELKREQKRTTHLCGTLVTIYGIAKDNMWHPSTFADRGESGFKTCDPYIENQKASVETYK